jgi:hypothetical protein
MRCSAVSLRSRHPLSAFKTSSGFHEGRVPLPTPPKLVAPPVQIFHPVFQEFLDRINNPEFEPDELVISIVSELMPTTMELGSSGKNALAKLRLLFADLLDEYVGKVIPTGVHAQDGMVFKQLGECAAPLLCIEYQRAFGEGGRDPSIQAAYSVREFLVLDQVCGFPIISHLH